MYNKSTLLWEADHYEAYKLMETLRVSRDPHARVSAALYNLRLLREKKASIITVQVIFRFRLRQRGDRRIC